jgi:hypothetical protein
MSGQAHDFGEMKSTKDEIFKCRNCGEKSEELFSTLDEAMKNCAVNLHLTQDANLIEQWKGGYELPADEYHDWPSAFLADNEGG